MPKISFIEHNGTVHTVDAQVGQSLMQAAIDNLIPGILGDCGGYANCATCHCYVATPWDEQLLGPDATEEGMLACAIDPKPNSRLSCQIIMTEELGGLTVELPASQL
ncbi:2Fe-2S iron-sulfur cluster-binding protein [Pseudomonas marginalis]|uniref:2Fe-2S iron-sulfur cluster-binding protein n=1 Tax=Pseudomonas TaxID=286 RepID=UPI00389AD493